MSIENTSRELEVQNRELQEAKERQMEQSAAEHQKLGENLDKNSSIDHEGERKQIDKGQDVSSPKENESPLDKKDNIENDGNNEQKGIEQNKEIEQQALEKNNVIDYDKSEKADMNASKENELWEKSKDICSEHYDKASANIEKDQYGNDYKELNQKEKEALSSELKENINNVPKGERGDYRVPEPEKIQGISRDEDGNTRIKEAWKDGTDGAKEGTRHMEVVKAKDDQGNQTYIDRIGSGNGNYFSPMKEDGEPYSLKERAIGDYLPEKNLQDNDSYHKYEVKQDFTKENFEKAIDKTYSDPDMRADKLDQLKSYYSDAMSTAKTDGHDGEAYKFNVNNIDGVKTGEIDNMFGTENDPDGGGKQYITPFNANELKEMDMIEEVKKEDN